jgi:hypothetical protein
MPLYLGSSGKIEINLGGDAYYLNLFSTTPITNGTRLLSSDDYALRDATVLYLTTDRIRLLTCDGHFLTSANDLYLTTKENY